MTEERFFESQREMQIMDWLNNHRFEWRDVIWIMQRLKIVDSLTNALFEWRIEKDKADPKNSQPNCS